MLFETNCKDCQNEGCEECERTVDEGQTVYHVARVDSQAVAISVCRKGTPGWDPVYFGSAGALVKRGQYYSHSLPWGIPRNLDETVLDRLGEAIQQLFYPNSCSTLTTAYGKALV